MELPQLLKQGGAVLGIGIDLTEVERVRAAHSRHGERFLNKVYTAVELEYCMALRDPYPSLAARFAAKEAVSKAFGTGICERLSWHSISVSKNAQDAPCIVLDASGERFLRELGGTGVLISLTHTRSLAQAIAALVGAGHPSA